MEISFVYVTSRDREDALRLVHVLLDERLIACANLLDGMTSVYRWEGRVHEERECVLILKTRTENLPALTRQIKELHSYETPCVVSWPCSDGNADYFQWVLDNTQRHA